MEVTETFITMEDEETNDMEQMEDDMPEQEDNDSDDEGPVM
ncbi:MAG TPA: hypothetical protein PKC72_07000 [Chitinophagaceae bacterium]|nr:hypothetical protein [Chitinophagaceae bacterium]